MQIGTWTFLLKGKYFFHKKQLFNIFHYEKNRVRLKEILAVSSYISVDRKIINPCCKISSVANKNRAVRIKPHYKNIE